MVQSAAAEHPHKWTITKLWPKKWIHYNSLLAFIHMKCHSEQYIVLWLALSMTKFGCSLKVSLSSILIPSNFSQLLLLISVSPVFTVALSLLFRIRRHLYLLALIWLLENHLNKLTESFSKVLITLSIF